MGLALLTTLYAYNHCFILISRHVFFLQVKAQLADGHLPVRGQAAAKLGALLFQAELGDQDSYGHQEDGYPKCLREWDQGTARFIAKEHAKLKGDLVFCELMLLTC